VVQLGGLEPPTSCSHRQRRRVDTGSLNCQSQEACHTQKPPRSPSTARAVAFA